MNLFSNVKLALTSAATMAALVVGAGCKDSAAYRREADRQANNIIKDKQQRALGRQEPFTVERPSDQLRRRLLLEQDLPVSGPASFGPEHVPRIPRLPKDVPAGQPIEFISDDVPDEAIISETTTQPTTGPAPVRISLVEALQIGARNSFDYQEQKEQVFRTALALDLERDDFRNTFSGLVSGDIRSDLSSDETVTGAIVTPTVGWSRRLYNGAQITTRLGIDLVKLLTQDKAAVYGIFADASITLPLLRGAGRDIVTEPLRQAERNVIYAIWNFEEYKRRFAVSVATQHLAALEQQELVRNNEDSYRRQVLSTRRARRLAEAGRLPQVQVDQAISQELRARDRLNRARAQVSQAFDRLKDLLGLPPDAYIAVDRADLDLLEQAGDRVIASAGISDEPAVIPDADQPVEIEETTFGGGGPLELGDDDAIRVALDSRLDLRTVHGRVYDAQRQTVVAANGFLPRLDITASADMGDGRGIFSANSPNGQLRPDRGVYSLGADLELPFERTAERNRYRLALLQLQDAARNVQSAEDEIKGDVREALRDLRLAKETLLTQARAVAVAQRRVASTTLFLEAGRVQIRDLLESQEALVTARNSFIGAIIDYRVAELDLQEAMGVLEVNNEGMWTEFTATRVASGGLTTNEIIQQEQTETP